MLSPSCKPPKFSPDSIVVALNRGAPRIEGMEQGSSSNNAGSRKLVIGSVLEASVELQEFLREMNARFCFIGGVAVQRWGEPRFTADADISLLTEFVQDEYWVDILLSRFESRRSDAREFALSRRVLLLKASNNVELDIALGGFPFEVRSIERASVWDLHQGPGIVTCSAEDLVVHKAFASRNIDWIDVEGILMRQGGKLDRRQILEELEPLADLKEDPQIILKLKNLMAKRQVD